MKVQPLLVALTVVNVAVLMITLLRTPATFAADEIAPVLRGRALEIVDDAGRVRASITVYPAATQKNGETSGESVVLRLITEKGRPSIKLGAGEQTSGIAVTGQTGTEHTYAQLLATGAETSLVLKDEDGGERVVQP